MLPLFLIPLFLLATTLARPVEDTLTASTASTAKACTVSSGGTALTGFKTPGGACRYTVKYGTVAQRWGYSSLATSLGSTKATELPPVCPQDDNVYVAGRVQSEDCLYAVVYTPPNPKRNLPVFVWIHGGSFWQGSASNPGLDGSALAVKGDMIVVVLQYRLGVLGFLPPALSPSSSEPNLGVLDVINALKGVQKYIDLLGGSPQKVTVGGQSSGGSMIRTLLAAPSARNLFRGAIIHSDPMTYSLSPPRITAQLQNAFYTTAPMSSCKTLACLQKLPLSNLIDAELDLIGSAPFTITGVPLGSVTRPTYNTATIPYDPTPDLFNDPEYLEYRPINLSLLITTTRNEGGSAIQEIFPDPVPANSDDFYSTLVTLIGQPRADAVTKNNLYPLGTDPDTFREQLERLVTDGTFRCPARNVAAKWNKGGGKVWVGEWRNGVTYPDNTGDYCQVTGRVCHQDDLYPTFGTAPSPSAGISFFETEIHARWISFITTLDPNPCASSACRDLERALAPWTRYRSDKDILPLGGDKVEPCPAIWGNSVQYDWQLYGQ